MWLQHVGLRQLSDHTSLHSERLKNKLGGGGVYYRCELLFSCCDDVARNIGPAKPEALRAESGFCQDGNESTDADAFGSDFSSSFM
jgi:hypothetical protein